MPNYRLVGIFVPSKQSHVIFEFVNIYKDKGLFRFLKLSDSSESKTRIVYYNDYPKKGRIFIEKDIGNILEVAYGCFEKKYRANEYTLSFQEKSAT